MIDNDDVPCGEDFHDERVAAAWAEAAGRKRPWRPEIFELFATIATQSKAMAPRVLEIGSGPGFLAEHVLNRCPQIARYTLLDFSGAMLGQSRQRLAQYASRTAFVQADFKSDSWVVDAGGPFDLVLSLQAVHELRHKRHAPRLYAQIKSLLSSTAEVAICDHLPEVALTERHRLLYMTMSENLAALASAGFGHTEVVWSEHDMAMYRSPA